MNISILGSGSKGNCSFISNDIGEAILIDAGLSAREVFKRAESVKADLTLVKAILLTHDHQDHIQYINSICQKLRIPVYTTIEIYQKKKDLFAGIEVYFYQMFFKIGNFRITPFPLPHDGTTNHGFKIDDYKHKLFFALDCGHITYDVFQTCKDADMIVMEANYDESLLEESEKPAYLKKRIKGELGHMNNKDTAQFIKEIRKINKNLIYCCFAHLSKDNNSVNIVAKEIAPYLYAYDRAIGFDISTQNSATALYGGRK